MSVFLHVHMFPSTYPYTRFHRFLSLCLSLSLSLSLSLARALSVSYACMCECAMHKFAIPVRKHIVHAHICVIEYYIYNIYIYV